VEMEAGLIWKDVYIALNRTGFEVMGGICPTVGVMGFITGGGYNIFLSRHWGMASDNVLSFKIVLYNGSIATASNNTNPELFWALRGGGGGNFGVITEVELQVHHHNITSKYRGYDYPIEQNRTAVIIAWHNWTSHIISLGEMNVGSELRHEPNFMSIHFWWSGDLSSTFDTIMQTWENMSPPPSSVIIQTWYWADFMSTHVMWNQTQHYSRMYATSAFVSDLTPAVIDLFARLTGNHIIMFFANMSKSNNKAFPFSGSVSYLINPNWYWKDENLDQVYLGEGKNWMNNMRMLKETVGAYVNYIDFQLTDWPRMYYSHNLEKLQQIKSHWDPHNFWKFPMSIPHNSKSTLTLTKRRHLRKK